MASSPTTSFQQRREAGNSMTEVAVLDMPPSAKIGLVEPSAAKRCWATMHAADFKVEAV